MNGIESEISGSLSKSFPGVRKESIVENILLFCRVLKKFKIDVTTGRVLDVFRSLKFINLSNKEDLYYALRANLVSEKNKIPIFDQAFWLFWLSFEQARHADDSDQFRVDLEDFVLNECFINEWQKGLGDDEPDQLPKKDITVYSPVEDLTTKDFSAFTNEDIDKILEEINKIAKKLATRKSRRKQIDPKGTDLSLRNTLRKNMKFGGDIFDFSKTKKKIKKIKLISLVDVSGSMDCYSNFFFQFIYSLQQRIKGIETFVFSTRLSKITDLFYNRDMDEVLKKISDSVQHWSGGTKIGFCVETFNDDFAPYMLDNKTVVIIISDGWDRGDTGLLEKEMKKLRDNCHKVIWLNPLLSSANYQPLCKGIKAALPYISYFLPFYNLQSLKDLGKILGSI